MTDTNSRVVEAIIGGDIDAFDVVVESGIDPSFVTDSDHWNYLHRALKSVTAQPTPAIVKRLIELGVDPSAQDRCGWTPLHFAARIKSEAIVQILVDAGAEVNSMNDRGVTPLHQSILGPSYDLKVAEILLAAGANPDMNSGRGTARTFATATSRTDVLDLFEAFAL